jgi:hypothetical protein
MFAAIDSWAQSIQPDLALQPLSAPTGFLGVRTSSLPAQGSSAARQSAGGQLTHALAAAQLAGSSASSRRTSSVTSSRPGSNEGARLSLRQQSAGSKQVPAQPAGAAAIAARLAAGCCPEAPYRQLQLLRGCYCWVLTHVQLPKDCDLEAGAELVTWDVGRHVFGERSKQVLLHEVREAVASRQVLAASLDASVRLAFVRSPQLSFTQSVTSAPSSGLRSLGTRTWVRLSLCCVLQVLLPGCSGTWAECVSQLLVNLLRACHMEAQQLSGFWKAGSAGSVGPGEQLASHNHSW